MSDDDRFETPTSLPLLPLREAFKVQVNHWPDYVGITYQQDLTVGTPESVRATAKRLLREVRVLRSGLPFVKIDFIERRYEIAVRLELGVRDVDDGKHLTAVCYGGISWEVFEGARDIDEYFLHFLRSLLTSALLHELDEALLFRGIRVRDPHGGDKR